MNGEVDVIYESKEYAIDRCDFVGMDRDCMLRSCLNAGHNLPHMHSCAVNIWMSSDVMRYVWKVGRE